jgi:hypothetical protein
MILVAALQLASLRGGPAHLHWRHSLHELSEYASRRAPKVLIGLCLLAIVATAFARDAANQTERDAMSLSPHLAGRIANGKLVLVVAAAPTREVNGVLSLAGPNGLLEAARIRVPAGRDETVRFALPRLRSEGFVTAQLRAPGEVDLSLSVATPGNL